ELIQHLPDPQASAWEMVRRGWITRDQLSSLFPGPEQRPTPRKTMLVGFGVDDSPPDADEDWYLPLSDEEEQADVTSEVEWTQPDGTEDDMLSGAETVEAIPGLPGAAATPPFELHVPVPALPVPVVAVANEARRRESDTDEVPEPWLGRASKRLLMFTLFLG